MSMLIILRKLSIKINRNLKLRFSRIDDSCKHHKLILTHQVYKVYIRLRCQIDI